MHYFTLESESNSYECIKNHAIDTYKGDEGSVSDPNSVVGRCSP